MAIILPAVSRRFYSFIEFVLQQAALDIAVVKYHAAKGF